MCTATDVPHCKSLGMLFLHCRSFPDDIVVGYVDPKASVRLNPADTCTPGPSSRLVLLTNGSKLLTKMSHLASGAAHVANMKCTAALLLLHVTLATPQMRHTAVHDHTSAVLGF